MKHINSYRIDITSAKQLQSLLEIDNDIVSNLIYLDKKYQIYKEEIEKGATFVSIIEANASNDLMQYFAFFLKLMPTALALKQAIKLSEFILELKNNIIKKASYPCLIFIFALVILYLFASFILPMLLQTFRVSENDQLLIILIHGMTYLCYFLLIVIVLMILLLILLSLNKYYRSKVILLLAKKFKIVSIYCSYLFCGFIEKFHQDGIDSITLMQFLSNHPSQWMVEIAKQIDNDLLKGVDFISALNNTKIFHGEFIKTMKLSLKVHNEAYSQRFMIYCQHYFASFFKKFGIILQGCAYLLVAMLVLLCFQVFMIPLNMLNDF